MSTQGDKLKAIADAIREVDGTDEPIVANDFPDRIRSISPGVKSFNGRTGDVVPAEGDYTAEQVGALPISGGVMEGSLGFDSNSNYGITANTKSSTDKNQYIILKPVYFASSPSIFFGSKYFNTLHVITHTEYGCGLSVSGYSNEDKIPDGASLGTLWVRDPTSDREVATKAYVDSKAGGISVASNAGAHNSLFRGKYLGSSVTAAQYAAIAAGTFDDLFIGDYWTINGINWRIAAFDYYLGTGSTALTTHHAVIVPDDNINSGKMNDSDTTSGGYAGSQMYTTNIDSTRIQINNTFPGHVLKHEFRLSSIVTNGKVVGVTNVNQDVVLMSERNVYGQTIMSSECNDGSSNPFWHTWDRTQFPLFVLAPEFIQKERSTYWLRDVVNASGFARVNTNGLADWYDAHASCGVRPAFSIKG